MTDPASRVPSMPGWISWLLCVAGCVLCGISAEAADSAQDVVQSGKQLARIACSACHIVASDSDFPALMHDPAPRFVDIADRPGSSEKSLRQFISTTHWDGESMPMTMPKPELTGQQVAAVSRYIMSLRKR
jgi:mono/diheme cytochrome c family protein